MIQFLKSILLLFAIGYSFSACNSCDYLECATGERSARFKFVSAATGKNLMFGPNKIYDTSQVRFYAVKGRDTASYQSYIYTNTSNLNDTALAADFFLMTDTAYIRFNNTDTDTIVFSFESFDTKCCGRLTDIVSVRYNKMQAVTNKEVIEIKK